MLCRLCLPRRGAEGNGTSVRKRTSAMLISRLCQEELTIRSITQDEVLLALGGNQHGPWGGPRQTLARTQRELSRAGFCIVRASRIYLTTPVGTGLQPPYLNAVLLARTQMGPAAVLRIVKEIERRAGRRFGRRWGPRSLDIDILDHGGRRLGWPPGRRERGRLILPHPELHRRAFVLVPLLDVVPRWRHPALGLTGRSLLRTINPRPRLDARQSLDFEGSACDKDGQD
jgi:2-amino-4-hydroxy-6-hydroxymethyldihydropteridine diphosphokinase